eukprot:4487393-Pleurochrysis_carterae.AAC.2
MSAPTSRASKSSWRRVSSKSMPPCAATSAALTRPPPSRSTALISLSDGISSSERTIRGAKVRAERACRRTTACGACAPNALVRLGPKPAASICNEKVRAGRSVRSSAMVSLAYLLRETQNSCGCASLDCTSGPCAIKGCSLGGILAKEGYLTMGETIEIVERVA